MSIKVMSDTFKDTRKHQRVYRRIRYKKGEEEDDQFYTASMQRYIYADWFGGDRESS